MANIVKTCRLIFPIERRAFRIALALCVFLSAGAGAWSAGVTCSTYPNRNGFGSPSNCKAHDACVSCLGIPVSYCWTCDCSCWWAGSSTGVACKWVFSDKNTCDGGC